MRRAFKFLAQIARKPSCQNTDGMRMPGDAAAPQGQLSESRLPFGPRLRNARTAREPGPLKASQGIERSLKTVDIPFCDVEALLGRAQFHIICRDFCKQAEQD
ncbi:hypothetical protein GCM10020258_52740 [Sphingomonas yabuuchiae]